MRILICYHSKSGNTERIANVMASALETERCNNIARIRC